MPKRMCGAILIITLVGAGIGGNAGPWGILFGPFVLAALMYGIGLMTCESESWNPVNWDMWGD